MAHKRVSFLKNLYLSIMIGKAMKLFHRFLIEFPQAIFHGLYMHAWSVLAINHENSLVHGQ